MSSKTETMHFVIKRDLGRVEGAPASGRPDATVKATQPFLSHFYSPRPSGPVDCRVRYSSMLRWTLLATMCSSVLQVSIANAPLSGGDDKDELRSRSISTALDVTVASRSQMTTAAALTTPDPFDRCDDRRNEMWKLWEPLRCDSCKSEVTFPVAFTNRQYWKRGAWAYCPQYAVTKFTDSPPSGEFHAFCPTDANNVYLRGMFILVELFTRVQWLPAEFLIPCDSAHKEKNITHHSGVPEWEIDMRHSSFVHVIKRFQANLEEGSPALCKDHFGNAHVTPQDALPACQYGTHVAAVGRAYTTHLLWTNNNYADLMEMFDPVLPLSMPAVFATGTAAVWRPIVDITERKDQCTLKYGFERETGMVHIYYDAQCACSANPHKCNPMLTHPFEGICPHAATVYMLNGEAEFEVESVRDISAFEDNPFDDACCSATFCDPDVDSSCTAKRDEGRFASGEIMTEINAYLWDSKHQTTLTTEVANQVHYCAYHSNIWSEGSIEERPEYCYVFVDYKWREFVNISSGWNFEFSRGGRLHFAKDKNCTIVHGTVRDYCPSILDCIGEVPALRRNACPPMDDNDKQHTVVACRCSTHENRTYYCDENITATDVLNWVEKPQCFTGTVPYRVRGRYDSSELTLVQSEDLNVLCYWYDYQDDDGKRWREYGFYNPDDVRFAGYRSLNCFPADCTPKRTFPHFCCCRTAENGAESVCNDPGSQLEEEVQVRVDRRDPEWTRTNVVERNLCEDRQPDHHVNVTDPRELVVGFPVRAMCYYKLELRHHKGSVSHKESSADEVTRRFYDASLQKQFPLSVLLCDRKHWTVSDWLDGCACLAARNGAQWEQNCCCISSTNPSSMDRAVKSEHEHRLRTFRDFL